jgi:hypothetical protein
MKERVIYNTYYEEFEDFRSAVFGFFSALPMFDPDSVLGQTFRKREFVNSRLNFFSVCSVSSVVKKF